MKKIIGGLAFFILISFVVTSCSKSETYADKLKKERKAINRFIDSHDIHVIYDYPSNGVFAENEFYLDSKTGVYMHVVDSGNGTRVSSNTSDKIYITARYRDAIFLLMNDTLSNTGPGSALDYIDFTYNQPNSYTDYTQSVTSNYYVKSEGLILLPLNHVGDGAIVKLIIPFDMGSGYQRYYYEPIYLGYVKYKFQAGQEIEK